MVLIILCLVIDEEQVRSVSAFDLILVDTSDGFEVSHATSSSALPVLGLEGPSVCIMTKLHFLSLAAGYPQAEQVCFCLW